MLKRLRGWLSKGRPRGLAAYALIFAAIFFIFFWRISTLVPGLSATEVTARQASLSSISSLFSFPVNLPYKILQYAFLKLDHNSLIGLRTTSVIFAIISSVCFYRLAASWFGRSIGLFAALIFASLPLLVISARQGTPEIMFFSSIILMWLYTRLIKADSPKIPVWLTLIIVSSLLIYTPGMIWWVLTSLAICRNRVREVILAVPAWVNAAGFLSMAGIITPLVIASVKHHGVIRQIVLIPAHWQPVLQSAKNIGWMALALVIKAPHSDPLIVGRLPVLNILLIGVMIFGAYAMHAASKPKAYTLGLGILFAVLAAGLNNNLALLALGLPATGLLIGAGLRYLYIEWRSIFPRNPVPKTFALALIAVLCASQLYYGLQYSLVAWPHSDATRRVYVLK